MDELNMRVRNKAKEYAALKVWRAKNPERFKASLKRYYNKNRERLCADKRKQYKDNADVREMHRFGNIAWYYGVSKEQYLRLLYEQDGLCAICRRPPQTDGRKRNLDVDHDHATDAPRGLLCGNCNAALGLVKENPETIAAMLAYLEKWNAKIPSEDS